jgi:uncharacterized protein
MPETVITVQGHHSAFYPAERATATVAVSADGPERDEVFARVTLSAEAVRSTIESLHDSDGGPITRWSSDTVSVWSERPWSNTGEQLELVHHATVTLTARFTEFTELSPWIESVVAIEGASISGIEWTLSEARHATAATEARSRAVKDAVAKATVYAQSIGLGSVTATAVADPGMLGDSTGSGPASDHHMELLKVGSADEGGSALALKPRQLEVTASVDARFIAR